MRGTKLYTSTVQFRTGDEANTKSRANVHSLESTLNHLRLELFRPVRISLRTNKEGANQ